MSYWSIVTQFSYNLIDIKCNFNYILPNLLLLLARANWACSTVDWRLSPSLWGSRAVDWLPCRDGARGFPSSRCLLWSVVSRRSTTSFTSDIISYDGQNLDYSNAVPEVRGDIGGGGGCIWVSTSAVTEHLTLPFPSSSTGNYERIAHDTLCIYVAAMLNGANV